MNIKTYSKALVDDNTVAHDCSQVRKAVPKVIARPREGGNRNQVTDTSKEREKVARGPYEMRCTCLQLSR